MTDCWDNITVGMKVEVQNFDCDLQSMVYWIATVIKLAGECPISHFRIGISELVIFLQIFFKSAF
jgi:hypothetical protein